jgi:peptide/nickel transport system substrate-binding protein
LPARRPPLRLCHSPRALADRYDGYWDGKAKAPGIEVTWIADGTARLI